jgi:hypothetical protein
MVRCLPATISEFFGTVFSAAAVVFEVRVSAQTAVQFGVLAAVAARRAALPILAFATLTLTLTLTLTQRVLARNTATGNASFSVCVTAP